MEERSEKPKKTPAPKKPSARQTARTLQETADEMIASVAVEVDPQSIAEFGVGSSAVMAPPAPPIEDVVGMATAPALSGAQHNSIQQWEPALARPTGLPLSVQDASLGLEPRARLAASLQATAGARLSTWEIAKAANYRHEEFLLLQKDPHYIDAVTAILTSASEKGMAIAVAHRAYRMSSIQADLDRLNTITSQRAASADMRYASRDPEWLRARGVLDPEGMLQMFPQTGEMYDPENPACQMFDPDDVFVPGAATGLLVKDKKTVGSGLAAEIIDVWALDTGLMKQRSDLLKQAAQEVGEWGPAADRGEAPTLKLYLGIDMSRL